jgi:cytochrome c-type biogenesis protein CcmH/NrfG
MANGAFGIAQAAYDQALMLYPTEPTVLKGVKELRRIMRQLNMEERKAA